MIKSKLIILVVIFVTLLSNSICANLKLIKTIEIDKNLKTIYDKSISTEFYSNKKRLLGDFYAINIQDIINLSEISDSSSVLIEMETQNGESILCSYEELSKEFSVIPPLFLVEKVTGSTGDTVTISENIEGNIDFEELDKELKIATVQRVYCQVSKVTKPKELVFKSGTVIFPMDICDRRWLTNVIRLKIYLFEK